MRTYHGHNLYSAADYMKGNEMSKKTIEDFEVPEGFLLISDANFMARIGKCENCKLQADLDRMGKEIERLREENKWLEEANAQKE